MAGEFPQLPTRFLGYDRRATDEAISHYVRQLERTTAEAAQTEERIRALDSEVRGREEELGRLRAELNGERELREREVQELRGLLEAERDRRDKEIQELTTDVVSKFLTNEVQPILAAAEETAARIVERARATGDQKVKRADVLFGRLQTQTERFHRWWDRIDPVFRRLQLKLEGLATDVEEVSGRVQSALAPLNSSVEAVMTDLREAAEVQGPPSPGLPLHIQPVTPDRWEDFTRLFGDDGGFGGCWCMQWRLPSAQFSEQLGDPNRRAMEYMVAAGEVPGLLGYVDSEPAAWCSLGPRDAFPGLASVPSLPPGMDGQLWSVVCFFVAQPFRRRGVMKPMLDAAVGYAKEHGARVVEAYPMEARGELPHPLGFTGITSVFQRAGFVEVARPVEHQAVMRYYVEDGLVPS